LQGARSGTEFDDVEAVVVLDPSFRALEPESRYFVSPPPRIGLSDARSLCEKYGTRIFAAAPLGYRDSQLLLGFHHNVPDNSVPMFWSEGTDVYPWKPVFRRYHKVYGWAGLP
jgi:hypothetical protein